MLMRLVVSHRTRVSQQYRYSSQEMGFRSQQTQRLERDIPKMFQCSLFMVLRPFQALLSCLLLQLP